MVVPHTVMLELDQIKARGGNQGLLVGVPKLAAMALRRLHDGLAEAEESGGLIRGQTLQVGGGGGGRGVWVGTEIGDCGAETAA